jgi:UDP-GlcNAc:undecaprenyl-phosphate GlcNAc-1-phosphate transferase
MQTFICVYLGSAFLAIIITPFVIKLACRIKAVDRPGVRTVHTRAVPRIGGVTIFLSAMILIVMVLFLDNIIGKAFRSMQLQLISLFCSMTFIFLVGLIDDLKGLPARFKFLAELLVACLLCFVSVRISSIQITEQWTVQLGLLSYPITILWIVGITNAVNLSDGLDGLAAGISAIACGVIVIFAVYSGNVIMAVIMLALLGSLSGFLFFNFNPAKIFMGDCGSLFLGFTIASSSVLCSTKSSALVGIALPFLALGIPIFDTLFSMLRRFLERRRMFAPDRRHFHHMLIDKGIKQRHVVVTIYLITLLFAGMGMFMMVTHDKYSIVIFACILILMLLLFNIVGSVRLRDTISGVQKKYEIANRCKQERMKFEDAQLHFRNAHNFEQWWKAACEAAERLDFAWLSLKSENEDGATRTEIWRTPDLESDLSRLVIMTIPLPQNCDKTQHEFEMAISVNGSLESAGHRATLFSRLIDEHCRVVELSSRTVTQSK